MEYGDFNLDEEQTKELNKNLDELSEKIDKYEREYDDRKVITDDLLTGLNSIEENLKNLINKADKIKVDKPPEIIKELTLQKYINIKYETENKKNRITTMKLLKNGKQLVLGTSNGQVLLYEIPKEIKNTTEMINNNCFDTRKEEEEIRSGIKQKQEFNCGINYIHEIDIKNNKNNYTKIVVSTSAPNIYILKVTDKLEKETYFGNKNSQPINSAICLDDDKYVYAVCNGPVIVHTNSETEKPKTINAQQTANPIALLKISKDLFCVSWKSSEPIKFYDFSGTEKKLFNNPEKKGCVVSNGLFFIPKSDKRSINAEYVVVGWDNDNDKGELYFWNLTNKSVQKVNDHGKQMRCHIVVFALFRDKYLLHAFPVPQNPSILNQIDIDKKIIVATFERKGEFMDLLGFLPEKEYLITDYEESSNKKRLTILNIAY